MARLEILSAGSKVVSCSCHSMSLGGEWPYLASDCKRRTFHNMPWCRPIGEMALQSRVPMSRLIQTTQASSCGVAASGTRCAGGVWLVCSGVPRRRNEVEELSRCDNHTGWSEEPDQYNDQCSQCSSEWTIQNHPATQSSSVRDRDFPRDFPIGFN